MAYKECFLITSNTETGEIRSFCAEHHESNNMYTRMGTIKLSEIPIPALQIGLKVVEAAESEGMEPKGGDCWIETGSMDRVSVLCLALKTTKPVEPPEPVGVEYLRTLADGTQFRTPKNRGLVTKMADGLHWVCGEVWLWDGKVRYAGHNRQEKLAWETNAWVIAASAETIHPWTTEQGEEKQ